MTPAAGEVEVHLGTFYSDQASTASTDQAICLQCDERGYPKKDYEDDARSRA